MENLNGDTAKAAAAAALARLEAAELSSALALPVIVDALRLLESGLVDPLGMIAAEYALEDGLEAFEYASQRGVLKVLLRP